MDLTELLLSLQALSFDVRPALVARSSERVTLQEVARRAKVSSATVSRVLNNTGRVKENARSRVLRAIDELNYHPNLLARTLARGRSRTLGLIVSNLKNPFFLDIFQALEADAHEKGFEVVVANTDYRPEHLVTQAKLMQGRRVAGLAVVVSEMEPTLVAELLESRIPVVFYDVGMAARRCAKIRTDYARGTRRVVEYLYCLGHRDLAFVGHHTALAPLNVRQSAFLDAVRDCCGQSARTEVVAEEDSPAGGLHATRQLFATGFAPTAVVCVNDFMAFGVSRALREMGLAVPRDVSVVGCDNISLSEFACPPLTTINVPRERIGHLVSEALMPDGEVSGLWGREMVIEPELIIRDSTGPPPSARR
jgi:DNA-binding LacI/PurR family transcriptional regulator